MSGQARLFQPRIDAGTLLGYEPAAPSAPAPGHLHRADDQGGSIASAGRVVESGRAETEARLVLQALRYHPGLTSAELALRSPEQGLGALGQSLSEWRTTCARRLPGLEDQGLVRAVVARPSLRRPHRDVDPDLAPCTVSPGAPQSIRWWPR